MPSDRGAERLGKCSQGGLNIRVGVRERQIHLSAGNHEDPPSNQFETQTNRALPVSLLQVCLLDDRMSRIEKDRLCDGPLA